ncbi:MAG TPA: DUF5683 domain-containing protein [Rhodothermales bacterium]|nr:DUF5683 domain-containing protein [Rhodothermales bacterium]HRR08511.1 DUF5683 domain-containing protein [Rhodothermales bacterium]
MPFRCFPVYSFLWVSLVPLLYGQAPDSLRIKTPTASGVATPDSSRWVPDPRMTLRWAILPGGGQYYNRERWKIPVVWAGVATATGFTVYFTRQYRSYFRAHAYQLNVERVDAGLAPTKSDYLLWQSSYNAIAQGRPIASTPLKQARDYHYRNTGFAILSVAGVWALATAEAYISAQLKDFDVAEIQPSLSFWPVSGTPVLSFSRRF